MMLARFLSDIDREALLGDLAESDASRFEIFREVLFLLIRRQFVTLLASLVLVTGAGRYATDLAQRTATYFLHGPTPSQEHASIGPVLFYLISFGFFAGRRLRMNSGPAIALNVTVVLCASTASVLIYSVGSGGTTAIGLYLGRWRRDATR